MNKYLVIGNPIAHSLSPLLHNYWFKKYRFLDSIYEKKKVEKKDLKKIVEQIKNDEVKGVNVTVPFKREIINFIDTAPHEVQFTKSVNTLVKENDKVAGYNTDQQGFQISLEENDWDCKDKKILIIGAGGVTPSILSTFIKVDGAEKIYLSNRTRSKAEELKKFWDKALGIYQMKKDNNLKFDIEVDGGINFSNSKEVISAGANILVSGTTIFKENNGDIKKNIETLKSM